MADRRAPGAVYKYSAQGQDLWLGREQFDECACGLAEISSTSAPTACRRSARAISIDRAEQLPAPLVIVFQVCMNLDREIDPCPTLQGQNFAALAVVFKALKL